LRHPSRNYRLSRYLAIKKGGSVRNGAFDAPDNQNKQNVPEHRPTATIGNVLHLDGKGRPPRNLLPDSRGAAVDAPQIERTRWLETIAQPGAVPDVKHNS